jgi:hypothetical protein
VKPADQPLIDNVHQSSRHFLSAVQHEVALLSDATKRHRDTDNDGRRQASIQEAAEALFRPRQALIDPETPPAASTDQPTRKPRVLAAVSAPSNEHEPTETSTAVNAPPAAPASIPASAAAEIPSSHAARIRAWIKYGMTPKQVAAIYGVEVGEVRQVLKGG